VLKIAYLVGLPFNDTDLWLMSQRCPLFDC
jgi:hypothetical protein